jgi:hypothetical protein
MKKRLCKKCRKQKRETLFSLKHDGIRDKTCRSCNYDGLTAAEKHKILREAYRNYLHWQDAITWGDANSGSHVSDVLTYSVPKEPGSTEYVAITISFYDLERALKLFKDGTEADGTVLSKRKEQAFFLNVIQDMLQRDVAEIMGITTVSVGQYVEQAVLQLSEYYYGEDSDTQDTTIAIQTATNK